MDSNNDIVPTLRMFDGLMMNKAADEIEQLRHANEGLKAQLAAAALGKAVLNMGLEQEFRRVGKRTINLAIEVPADWEKRLDMQQIVETQIAADRWSWNWPEAHNAGIERR